MLSIFIMLIVAIAMAAAIGFGILSLIKTAETSLGVQKNQTRLAAVSASIRSYVRTDGDDVLIPIEVTGAPTGSFSATLPSFVPYSTTVWGKPLIYCPVSPSDAIGAGTVTNVIDNDDDEEFDVDYTTEGTVTYISAGAPQTAVLADLRANGVIALILSPGPNSDGNLRCSDVELADDGETVLIDGGSVRTVSDIPAETDGKTFVLDQGSYNGSRKTNASMLIGGFADITSYVRGYGARDVEVILPAQDASSDPVVHYISKEDLSSLLDEMKGRTLRLTGEAGGSTIGVEVLQGEETDKEWEAEVRGKLVVSDVSIEGYEVTAPGVGRTRTIDVGLNVSNGGDLTLENAVISHIRVAGGRAAMNSGAKVRPEYGTSNFEIPLRVEAGSLLIDPEDSLASPFLEAVTATNAILVSGGSTEVKSSFSATLGAATERLFLATDGGRISRASPDVVASVTRAGTTVDEAVPVLSEVVETSNTCADDSESCSIVCPSVSISSSDAARETFVAWGECSSSDGAAISGTVTAADRQSFTCAWQLPAAVVAPTAKAFCEIR